jgi:hypothetical protein
MNTVGRDTSGVKPAAIPDCWEIARFHRRHDNRLHPCGLSGRKNSAPIGREFGRIEVAVGINPH